MGMLSYHLVAISLGDAVIPVWYIDIPLGYVDIPLGYVAICINMFTTLIHSFIPTSESLVDLFGNVRERRSLLRRVPRSLRRHFRFFAELRRVQGHLASISRENVHRGDSWKTMQEEEEVEEERRKRGRINHCACN